MNHLSVGLTQNVKMGLLYMIDSNARHQIEGTFRSLKEISQEMSYLLTSHNSNGNIVIKTGDANWLALKDAAFALQHLCKESTVEK